jgi:transglutaminase-like putative cysteine protease
MKATSQELKSIHTTGQKMVELVKKFHEDLKPFDGMQFSRFYDLARRLPYRSDPTGVEFLQRPAHALKNWNVPAMPLDCDDKAVLIGAFLYRRGIPVRFLAVSNKPSAKIHHACLEGNFGGKWVLIDATYPYCRLGVCLAGDKPITNRVVIGEL